MRHAHINIGHHAKPTRNASSCINIIVQSHRFHERTLAYMQTLLSVCLLRLPLCKLHILRHHEPLPSPHRLDPRRLRPLIRPHLRQPSPPPESPSATARVATRSSRITSTRPKRFFASLDHPTLPRSLPTNNFSQFHKTKFRTCRLRSPPTPYTSLVCVVVVKCTSAKRRGRKAPLLATFSSGQKTNISWYIYIYVPTGYLAACVCGCAVIPELTRLPIKQAEAGGEVV